MTKKRVKKDPRQRHPITFWRQVKSLHREGKNLKAISDELGVDIKRTAFFNNIRKKFDDKKVKSRKFNHTHKRTDNETYKAFESDVVELFNKKNRTGSFGYLFIGFAAQEVRRRDKYKDDELLRELKFSNCWTQKINQLYQF